MANRRRRAGFSLIELMVVLVILGMLAGAISFSVFQNKRDADIRAARLDAQALAQAVDMHRLKHATLPESLDALVPNEIPRLRKDPWGSAFVFTHTGDNFQIVSYGPDKAQGGGDDIVEDTTPVLPSRS